MILSWLHKRTIRQANKAKAQNYIQQTLERMRQPFYYAELQFCNDFEGRFGVFAIESWFMIRHLRVCEDEAIIQEYADALVTLLDDDLRLNGISDIRIGKKVKQYMQKLYGQWTAYSKVIGDDSPPNSIDIALLHDVIYRNNDISHDHAYGVARYITKRLDTA